MGVYNMTTRTPKTVAHRALALHKKLGGKIAIKPLARATKELLQLLYTPGVGAVSSYLAEHPEQLRDYTLTGRTVAVVSDGSAVLGLGNIGPEGAMPVMEGKALLFKEFGGVNFQFQYFMMINTVRLSSYLRVL
jgi:malate dehydrogenase (oxaloacetate-decarboxylating)